jgi:hypothetical protein
MRGVPQEADTQQEATARQEAEVPADTGGSSPTRGRGVADQVVPVAEDKIKAGRQVKAAA